MPHGDRVPDWLLERVALGEVPEAQASAIGARCAADASTEERLGRLAGEDEAFLAAHPAGPAVAEIERRREREHPVVGSLASRRRARWAIAGTTTALAGATALLLLLGWPDDGDDGVRVAVGGGADAAAEWAPADDLALPPGDTRVKGGRSHLVLHRQRSERPELLSRGQMVAEGDRVQLSYVADRALHGVILSIDGRGVVTVHHPAESGGSTLLEREGSVHLAHSYQLDDAPNFERFFFVTAQLPIDVAEVHRAAEALATTPRKLRTAELPLGGSFDHTSFLLRKEARR